MSCSKGVCAQLQAILAIAHIQLAKPAEVFLFIIFTSSLRIESEALALYLLRCDTDDRLGAGCVTGTRVSDDFHRLDVVGMQTVQLALVSHLSSIDIDNRLTASEYLDAAILGRNVRDAVEQVLHGSCLLKYGSDNGCRHSAILQNSLRQG